jgi:hypothetical protein
MLSNTVIKFFHYYYNFTIVLYDKTKTSFLLEVRVIKLYIVKEQLRTATKY